MLTPLVSYSSPDIFLVADLASFNSNATTRTDIFLFLGYLESIRPYSQFSLHNLSPSALYYRDVQHLGIHE